MRKDSLDILNTSRTGKQVVKQKKLILNFPNLENPNSARSPVSNEVLLLMGEGWGWRAGYV